MAIFHLSFSNGKVGKGLAHFKYIMGEDRYSYKEDEVIYEKHNMPSHVSAEDFWQSADAYERVNGRVYKEIRIALPNGFSKKENQDLLNKFLEKELGNNFYYSTVIHDKDSSEDGIRNTHAHIMICPRKIDGIERDIKQFFSRYNSKNIEKGGALKDPYWNKIETLTHFRESWEETLNSALEKKNWRKVSCKSLKEQKKKALENQDLDLVDFLDREPVQINNYTLKKDKKYYNEMDIADWDRYIHNKKVRDLKEELYNLLQKKKEQEIERSNIFKNLKDINSAIKNFNKSDEFQDIYSIQEDILMLEVEKKHTELAILNLSKTDEIKELQKLEAKILSINLLLKDKNDLLNKEIEELKAGDLFEKKYKELNKKNFQNDYKRFLKTQSEISKLEKRIEENKTKLENSKKIVLNILTKGEYSKILREYKNEEQAEMLLKLEKRFSKGKNKNLYIRTKYNLEKKYRELINTKTMELEKKKVLNNILEGKLDFKDKNNLIIETINSLQKDIANINNQIEKRELQIKSLEKINIQIKIYDEISEGEFSKITKRFEVNEKEIDKLNEQLKNVNTFNFSLKNKIKAEIEKLEKENSSFAIKYENIKKSITDERFNSLKEEYLHRIENGIKTYRKEINNLKDERQHIHYALRRSKELLFKTSKSNIPSIKNFIENHNRYKANLGEVLRTNINIRWSEDELEKQMRREMDFSI
ncbi:MobA/MobL family protein [Fusobacterium canifelinum]|uniref:MobA/MobL family protein n=1 Tax=Fusobacterium canifelinum TaxID=285729 RepID=A0A7T4FQI6_9FUSO|nr:MobA/MobL family protein [Fusobacterium canifelinum]QQB74847.1 MobA/MobL family protein [Fusobacterium canifelinum]